MSCSDPKLSLSDTDGAASGSDAASGSLDRRLIVEEVAERSQRIAQAFGYTVDELKAFATQTTDLHCDNPTAVAVAKLKEGERALDIGSGEGTNVFIAASKVGPTGQAIGIDSSNELIDLARQSAEKQGYLPLRVSFTPALLNQEFPIESTSIDCIISSHPVISLLSPEGKANAFKEAYRVLKPEGRIVFNDIVARKALPEEIKANLTLDIGSISDVLTKDDYQRFMTEAGFEDGVLFVDRQKELNVYRGEGSKETQSKFNANEWIGSYQIYAIKPLGESLQGPTPAELKPWPTALKNWWDAYSPSKASPQFLTPEEVDAILKDPELKGKVAVIDGRIHDYGMGQLPGSEKWLAWTLKEPENMAALFEKHKNTERVIFYCQTCRRRGPRSAGWYQDYVDSQGEGKYPSKAFVLQGGMKNWRTVYPMEPHPVTHDAK